LTFCSLATQGRDVVFDMGRVAGYRNFCNKLWNAARYVLMNTEGQDTGLGEEPVELGVADRWIISRLQRAEREVIEAIEGYRFDQATQALYEFAWDEYCDWYLELSKQVLTGESSESAKRGTRRTLVQVLDALLRLAHPLMPFVTEEIWQRVAPLAGVSGSSISTQTFPLPDKRLLDPEAETEIEWLQAFLLGVRRIRAEMNLAPGKPLDVVLNQGSAADRARLKRNHNYLQRLGRLDSIDWLAAEAQEPDSAIALVGELRILIPMAGLIDKTAELARLDKEINRLDKEQQRLEAKLTNQNFVAKAPPEVVAKERDKAESVRVALEQLQTQQQRIRQL
jgi:valyl-tRNA synthetase